MSNTHGQEDYIQSLKEIKKLEDEVQIEIDQKKNYVEDEIKKLQNHYTNSIAEAEQEGKLLVENSIKTAKDQAKLEADKIILDAEQKSKNISFKPDNKVIKEIIEILISDL